MSGTFYKIIVSTKRVKGNCDIHKVGDSYDILGPKLVQGGICIAALNAIYPYVNGMKYGEQPFFLNGKDVMEACCPDPKNLVTFEISRVEMDEDRPPISDGDLLLKD